MALRFLYTQPTIILFLETLQHVASSEGMETASGGVESAVLVSSYRTPVISYYLNPDLDTDTDTSVASDLETEYSIGDNYLANHLLLMVIYLILVLLHLLVPSQELK